MTWPEASLAKLEKLRVRDYLVRFVFGGAITALAGWIGARYGLGVGGMFLAFPAILPASLTLVAQHGGRRDALDDARGGRVGAVALAAFALTVVLYAERWPVVAVLGAALGVWLVVAAAGWWIALRDR